MVRERGRRNEGMRLETEESERKKETDDRMRNESAREKEREK